MNLLKGVLLKTRPVRYAFDAWTYRRSREGDKLIPLRDTWRGRPALIVGNGPSINRTPLESFVGIHSIGMNKINILFDRSRWRPSMIVAINNLVIQQNRRYYEDTDIPVFLSWKARWYLPRSRRGKIRFLLNRFDDGFSTDIAKGIGSSGTVTYSALQMAYYLGANPVILVGVDHRFSVDGKPNEVRRLKGADVNHFDPSYFAGKNWGIPNLVASECAFRRSRIAFEVDNRTVLDATVDGALDVFEKVCIQDALSLCGLKA